MRFAALVLALGACGFPTRSEGLSCAIDEDCAGGRTCEGGFCVRVGDNGPDAGVAEDSATDATPEPDADPFEAIAAQCSLAGYTTVAGTASLFRDVPQAASWTNAQADCKNDVAGATHLIVLSSQAEVDFMKTKLGWVGLFDNDTDMFMSVTGEPNDLRPFISGQPDNGGGDENCVQMKAGGLDDDQCNSGHRYVCECDGLPSTP